MDLAFTPEEQKFADDVRAFVRSHLPVDIRDKVKNGKGAFGFNAATEEYEDLVKAGVIDPTKVVRAALQNAASVASLMLTTEALVAERPKKKSAAGGHGHGGGGGGGMGGMGGMGGDEDF